VAFVESCPSPAAYTAEAAVVAAQSCAVQAERLEAIYDAANLAWWGAWALVGLLLVVLLAPFWRAAWGFEGKLGRG
jgi:hypothetical protein